MGGGGKGRGGGGRETGGARVKKKRVKDDNLNKLLRFVDLRGSRPTLAIVLTVSL